MGEDEAPEGGQLYGQDSASYLGIGDATHAVLGDVDASYLNHFASDELSMLQAQLADLEMLKRTSNGPNSGPGVDMWSRAGLQATVDADEVLVAGVCGLDSLDAEASAYRAGVELIFGTRARIGRPLRVAPF